MYAVIATGGKQYKVSPGDTLEVELLPGKDSYNFDQVLLLVDGDKVAVGTPLVAGAKVMAEILGTGKDDKVTTFRYKNKINYHRTIGHRQNFTRVQIKEIQHGT